jgi:hypothetical protein
MTDKPPTRFKALPSRDGHIVAFAGGLPRGHREHDRSRPGDPGRVAALCAADLRISAERVDLGTGHGGEMTQQPRPGARKATATRMETKNLKTSGPFGYLPCGELVPGSSLPADAWRSPPQ